MATILQSRAFKLRSNHIHGVKKNKNWLPKKNQFIYRMQKLELLISSLSNVDGVSFKKCKPFILEFKFFLKSPPLAKISKDFKVEKSRCHFHISYMHFRALILTSFNISRTSCE